MNLITEPERHFKITRKGKRRSHEKQITIGFGFVTAFVAILRGASTTVSLRVSGANRQLSAKTLKLTGSKRTENIMRRTKVAVMSITLFAFTSAFAAPLYAQHRKALSGKAGMARFSSKVRVGDVLLPAGMYHVQHVVEGSDHAIVFNPVTMPAGYKEYQMTEGREVETEVPRGSGRQICEEHQDQTRSQRCW